MVPISRVVAIAKRSIVSTACSVRAPSWRVTVRCASARCASSTPPCSKPVKRSRILPNSRGEIKAELARRINIIVPVGQFNLDAEVETKDVVTAVDDIARQGLVDRGEGGYAGVDVDLLLVTAKRLQQRRESKEQLLTWGTVLGTTTVTLGILIVWVRRRRCCCGLESWTKKRSPRTTPEEAEGAPGPFTIYRPPKTPRRGRPGDEVLTEDST